MFTSIVLTHIVSELDTLGIAGKLSMPSITLCKKNLKNSKKTLKNNLIQNLLLKGWPNPIDHNMVNRNFKGKINSYIFIRFSTNLHLIRCFIHFILIFYYESFSVILPDFKISLIAIFIIIIKIAINIKT